MLIHTVTLVGLETQMIEDPPHAMQFFVDLILLVRVLKRSLLCQNQTHRLNIDQWRLLLPNYISLACYLGNFIFPLPFLLIYGVIILVLSR